MKKIYIGILLVIVVLISSGCANSNVVKDQDSSSILAEMRKNKIENLGDNTGVGKLISLLPNLDKNYKQNFFSLQTETEPYGLTIYYEPVDSSNIPEMSESEEMKTYSHYLFDCIGDLGYVEYAYRATPSTGDLVESEYKVILSINKNM